MFNARMYRLNLKDLTSTCTMIKPEHSNQTIKESAGIILAT